MEEKSRLAIQQTMGERFDESIIVANSSVMKELLARTDQAAVSDASVFLLGETGVGKELFARRIHHMSHRRSMPFIAVNLSSIPETLLESELFGHEKGAFTGAHHQKPGLLELADKGTLFLDEVGDIPYPMQVKLLRVLQEKTFTRIGGIRERFSDFRIITATNHNIMKEVASGRFREDLYYRLSVIPLVVPPLRDRGNDIIDLANYYITFYKKHYHKPNIRFTRQDKALLKGHFWPGNVRELKNVLERAVILSTSEKLALSVFTTSETPEDAVETLFSDNPSLDDIQRRYILHVLKKTNGIIGGPRGASEILQINRSTLYFRMKKLGIRFGHDKEKKSVEL
jgi:transcriptional regulator with GAF, ATPase, and Fis domain